MDSFDIAVLGLRVGLGAVLIAHGCHKLFLGGRLAGTAAWFESLGMAPGPLHARAAATTEIGAGLALAAGFLTAPAAAAFVALMLVAVVTVHRRNGFYVMDSGWEYNFLIALAAVAVATLGAGRASAEQLLFGHPVLTGWTGLALALAGGLAAGTAQLLLFYRPTPAPTV
ncbi:DoxX family protein [Nocardia otitidiscaviarum]|uniref:DoxX family protein n=1 Tax=Nocardia otitidiscaviarum TaxID=1823 RepID=UPI00189328C0|nr:DoxX family protein [Nocardia otitidiscaviarum]MBF6236803.1 DoxX family protein [Nocardia otitidiscaviarum]